MNMIQAVQSVLGNYANFDGRARRSEYWFWALSVFIAGFVVVLIDRLAGTYPLLYVILLLAILVPNLAVGCRRLHDTGRSGWLQLIGIIPIIGTIILIVFFCGDSEPGVSNAYGQNPKGAGAYPR